MARKSRSQPSELTKLTQMTEEFGGYDREYEQLSKQDAEGNSTVAQPKPSAQTLGKSNMSEMNSIIEYSADLAEAEAPVPLPVGDYPAEIRGVERKTSGKGNEYINVTFMIAPESYPPDYTEGSEEGTILSYGRLSPEETQRARYGMRKFAESIGAKLGKTVDLNEWVGLSAIVTVVHDTYEGETRAQIKKVNPA